jgi:hypothetical protein
VFKIGTLKCHQRCLRFEFDLHPTGKQSDAT